MVDHKKQMIQNVWPMLQTLVLVAGVAGIFLSVGRRDQVVYQNTGQLKELGDITQDLVKSQVLSQANDQNHADTLKDLKRRIERLEDARH